ncbi:hypothetical protein POTOM_034886 [Populus tomentosa]|uniref:Uncharacterized protein n=1 Tax=Populus tomentosa TaxID=118781 RepID=A0A8X7Z651_POPTO|nr:hypothetical protein POTOM_034886 [Populus tomentosa]
MAVMNPEGILLDFTLAKANPDPETFFHTSFFEFYIVGCSLRCVQFRCKAVWVKIHGADSTLVTANLMADNNSTYDCVGTVLPRMDAGHFSMEDSFLMHLQGTPDKSINITIASASLQSFTEQQWRTNQQDITNTARTDSHGERLQEAYITIDQISKDFPFGLAIASTILGNLPYQATVDIYISKIRGLERGGASVNGIGLENYNLQNLLAGDVVDKLLKEWKSGEIIGRTDDHGSYSFFGF